MRTITLLICIVAFVMYLTIGADAVQYKVIDLGIATHSDPLILDINNSGQIICTSFNSDNIAVLLNPDGSSVDFRSFFDTDVAASAINNAGQVALYVHGEVYRWSSATGPVDLAALPGVTKSIPSGINELGHVVGSGNNPYTGAYYACLWKADDTIVNLGLGSAIDINDAGTVVGVSEQNWPSSGVVWNSNGSVLSTIGNKVNPERINNAGQVVGNWWKDVNRRCAAFSWTEATGFHDLPLLLGGSGAGLISDAHDINESGQIVGYSTDASGNRRAVLWDNNLNIMDLAALPGCTQSEAYAINDVGWVVGYSSNVVNGGGNYHLTLWEPVPEPASFLALCAGLVPLLLRRHKR